MDSPMQNWLTAVKATGFATICGVALNAIRFPFPGLSPLSRQFLTTLIIAIIVATLVRIYTVLILNRFLPDQQTVRLSLWQRWKQRRKRTEIKLKD